MSKVSFLSGFVFRNKQQTILPVSFSQHYKKSNYDIWLKILLENHF